MYKPNHGGGQVAAHLVKLPSYKYLIPTCGGRASSLISRKQALQMQAALFLSLSPSLSLLSLSPLHFCSVKWRRKNCDQKQWIYGAVRRTPVTILVEEREEKEQEEGKEGRKEGGGGRKRGLKAGSCECKSLWRITVVSPSLPSPQKRENWCSESKLQKEDAHLQIDLTYAAHMWKITLFTYFGAS